MSGASRRAELEALRLGDPARAWEALGFDVRGSSVGLGGVELELGADREGISGWRLRGVTAPAAIDGLATEPGSASARRAAPEHPNGAIGLDHVVVTTPDFDRTADALANAGIELRRIREAPGGFRQGFRRLGPAILELVEAQPDDSRAGHSGEAGGRAAGRREAPSGPARFWGLVVIVSDLEALAARLGSRLGEVKDAVQPDRRIATLRRSAGLGQAVAFMSPEP